MPIEYVNRRGERYFLLQGKTKTGKPKYYASRKMEGDPVDKMPDGYELYESPERGIVSVRKVRPSRILPGERELLTELTRRLGGSEYFIVDVQGDSMVIYTSGTDPDEGASRLSRVFGEFVTSNAAVRDLLATHTQYSAMLRFTLEDGDQRLYSLARWCFRGSVDGWFFLDAGRSLESLAKEYLPHLNRQSFFDLI